jgi:hypothetical protein
MSAVVAVMLIAALVHPPSSPVRNVRPFSPETRPSARVAPFYLARIIVTPRVRDGTPPVPQISAFAIEQQMSRTALMTRWYPELTAAAQRFGVPVSWMRSVMALETGGRTMSAPNIPITSSAGAMGLMQLMPQTYRDMRAQYKLGPDPYNPHDNIVAAAAYLRWLRSKYGYPAMFAAYNDGPGNLEQRLLDGKMLPLETQLYVGAITGKSPRGLALHGGPRNMTRLTRPDGTTVMVDAVAATSVREPLPEEYAPTVHAVITAGRLTQGVRESVARAKAELRAHGGAV